jgi:hypothetical protein
MRIGVAIGAGTESKPYPPRLGVWARRMTLLTANLRMQSRQWVSGPGVIKLRCIFPILEIVALLAILS